MTLLMNYSTAAATSQMVYYGGHTKSDLNLIKSRSVPGSSAADWWTLCLGGVREPEVLGGTVQ